MAITGGDSNGSFPLRLSKECMVRSRIRVLFANLRDILFILWQLLQEHRWIVGLILSASLLLIYLTDPIPPREIRISTYSDFPLTETEHLEALGLKVRIIPTQGSLENARRLKDPTNPIDIALIQGGALSDHDIEGLETLGSIAFEPVWTFYRKALKIHPTRLSELRGLKIALGPDLSGSKVVARKLFAEDGIDIDQEPGFLSGKSSLEYAKDLEAGLIDVVVEVNPHADPHIKELLSNPEISLMSYDLAEAYHQKFRFIEAITLPKGSISIHDVIPPQDVHLIATTLNIVIDNRLHPDLQTLFLVAARQANRKPHSLLFGSADRFPRYMDPQIPLSETAQHFYAFGMPSSFHYFPARFAGFVDRYWVLFLGVLSVGYTLVQVFLELGEHLSRLRHKPLWERLSHIRRIVSQRDAQETIDPSTLKSYRNEIENIYSRLMEDSDPVGNDAEFMLIASEAEKVLERIELLDQNRS